MDARLSANVRATEFKHERREQNIGYRDVGEGSWCPWGKGGRTTLKGGGLDNVMHMVMASPGRDLGDDMI